MTASVHDERKYMYVCGGGLVSYEWPVKNYEKDQSTICYTEHKYFHGTRWIAARREIANIPSTDIVISHNKPN